MEFQRAIILGSGSSSSTPFLTCVLGKKDCAACHDAVAHPAGRNHRLNPSFLIELRHPADGSTHHILIDCGKTFRETVLKLFPQLGVQDLSAVLLTHDHADASMGIDDLRELNRKDKGCPDGVLDVYADARTIASMNRIFYYLFPDPNKPVDAAPLLKASGPQAFKTRPWMASLAWHTFVPDDTLMLSVACRDERSNPDRYAPWCAVPLPVIHGKNYHCNAFVFPLHTSRHWLLYVSDVSNLELAGERETSFMTRVCAARARLGDDTATEVAGSSEAAAVAHNRAHPLEVLVLDMMSHNEYFSHFNTEEAIAAATRIGAKKTYFVGMSHSLEYKALSSLLAERGVGESMFVGYDGCVVAEVVELSHAE